MRACEEPVRGGSTCRLDPGHDGHHASVAYVCDGCSRTCRGTPEAHGTEGTAFCFLCVGAPARRAYERELRRDAIAATERGLDL